MWTTSVSKFITIGRKKTPYDNWVGIDFKQPFHPLIRSRDYYATILRFEVYIYVPACKEFHENINYFWIESPDQLEQAIFAINWGIEHWKSKEVICFHRLIVLRGDVEMFGYAKMLLLEKLYDQKEKEFIQRGYDLTLKK